MAKGKTKSGFKFEIDENKLNEWDVFEAIADMSSGDAQRMVQGTVTFVNTVLGDDKTALFEFIRKKNKGYCPQDQVQFMVNEIVEAAKEIKNSSSSQG